MNLEFVLFPAFFLLLCIIIFISKNQKYDDRGFDKNRIHKNGTKYDDFGYDFFGFDRNGYSKQGYNNCGKNDNGEYNRLYDLKDFIVDDYSADGFLNPRIYRVALTKHARQRMKERLGITEREKMYKQALDAYRFGKSARQVSRKTADEFYETEKRHENSVVLLYDGYIYIFSRENVLITVYENIRKNF